MVGDLKGGIPLNPSDDFELASYLTPLLATYNSDIVEMKEGKRVVFNAFNSWAVMGTSYSNLFIRTMQEVDAGTRSSKQATVLLSQSLKILSLLIVLNTNTMKANGNIDFKFIKF